MEWRKQVFVGLNDKLVVGDHDFTKLSLVPSVNFIVNIPESIEGTFYHGKVFVDLKNSAFQSSSLIRHARELLRLRNLLVFIPIPFFYYTLMEALITAATIPLFKLLLSVYFFSQ